MCEAAAGAAAEIIARTLLGADEHLDAAGADDEDRVGELVAEEPDLQRARLGVQNVLLVRPGVDDERVGGGPGGALRAALRPRRVPRAVELVEALPEDLGVDLDVGHRNCAVAALLCDGEARQEKWWQKQDQRFCKTICIRWKLCNFHMPIYNV